MSRRQNPHPRGNQGPASYLLTRAFFQRLMLFLSSRRLAGYLGAIVEGRLWRFSTPGRIACLSWPRPNLAVLTKIEQRFIIAA